MTSPTADVDPEARRSPAGLFAAGIAALVPIAFSPNVNAFFWTPRYALLWVIAAVGVVRLALLSRGTSAWAARAALSFVLVAAVATLSAANVPMAALGLYGHGNGLLFVAALAGAWAIGATIPDRSVRDVAILLVIGGCVNAAVGLVQTVVDLSEYHLALFPDGRAAAFMGNPVHLGALCVAAFALVARAWGRNPAVAVAAATLLAAGVQISGSRFALGIAALVVVAVVPHSWRRALVLVACLGIGLAAGDLIARSGDQLSSTARAQVAVAGGAEARIESWVTSLHAIADRPVVGAGPGQFRAATSKYRTPRLSRLEGADRLFYDAHNTFVEHAVTTGVLGVAAYVAWIVLAATRARGPLLWFAGAMLLLHLVQPHSVATTPLLFLALGCALPRTRGARAGPVLRMGSTVLTTAAAAVGVVILIGDFRLDQARLDFKLTDAQQAGRLLPPWPEPAEIESRIWLFESIRNDDDPVRFERAVDLRRLAAERDDAPVWWIELAELELASSDPGRAGPHFRRALALDPQSVRARAGLAELAMRRGRYDEAEQLLADARDRTRDPIDLSLLETLEAKLRSVR